MVFSQGMLSKHSDRLAGIKTMRYQLPGQTNFKRRGAAIAETAVCVPVLFLLLFGTWEVGRLVHISQVVSNSAREGARLASTGLYSSSTVVPSGTTAFEVQRAVANYLHNSSLPITAAGVSITVSNETKGWTATANVTPNATNGQGVQIAVTASGATPVKDPTLDTSIAQFDRVRVDVVYPFQLARWSPNNLFFFLGPSRNVSASARWLNLRDKPINLNTTIPVRPLT
jgi:Flp pilus assembly protein TadG